MSRRVLFLTENEPATTDDRVWFEARSLVKAGWDVTVVAPEEVGLDEERFEIRDGVAIHRYRPRWAAGGPASYLAEYLSACWHIGRLVRRIARRHEVAVVHAANPPDFLLLTAWPLKRRGTKFIFDHHDLAPELVEMRFGGKNTVIYRATRLMERIAFSLADIVIVTNESYRRVAIGRGAKRPEDVFVVRNGPDLASFRALSRTHEPVEGDSLSIVYVGAMAPQDGLDHALRALFELGKRRRDWRATFVGDGIAKVPMERLARDLGLTDVVHFTGFLAKDSVVRVLSDADVCLAPEPKTALNDQSTMIKIIEYMAIGRPIVSYDLTESRVTAADAALYARPTDEADFARCIECLLDDAELRRSMGERGRVRVERELSWEYSERVLLAAYEHLSDSSREPAHINRSHACGRGARHRRA